MVQSHAPRTAESMHDTAQESPTGIPLNLIDRLFVRLICGSYAPQVFGLLRSAHATTVFHWDIGRGTGPSFAGDMLNWLRLFAHSIQALARPVHLSGDVVVWEWRDLGLEARRAFLDRYLGAGAYVYLDKRWRRNRSREDLRTAVLAFAALPLVLLAWVLGRSPLAEEYVHILMQTAHARSAARLSRSRDVYVLQLYHLCVPFVTASIMRCGARVWLLTATTPLYPNQVGCPGDGIVLTHPAQAFEWWHYRERLPQTVKMWGPTDMPAFVPRPPSSSQDLPLGVYTQGFWLRREGGYLDPVYGPSWLAAEEQLIEAVVAFIESHPDCQVVLFPHPMERRALAQGARLPYDSLIEHPQVRVDASALNSIDTFDTVGLGVTTHSTVGFDRLYAGRRTLFYQPVRGVHDPDLVSPFCRCIIPDAGQLVAATEQYLGMSDSDFMNLFFRDWFDVSSGRWSSDIQDYRPSLGG